MAGLFLGLGFLAYLFLLIDWKSLRPVLAQGGWATAALYIVLAILFTTTYVSPPHLAAHSAPAAHHGE